MPIAPPDRDRGRRRKRRQPKPKPYKLPPTFHPEASQRRERPVAGPPAPRPSPRPSGPSFAEPFRKPHGLERERVRARDRTRRAEKRLPDHPGIPHVPVKAQGYTPAERKAIHRTYRRAAQRQGVTIAQLYRLASPRQRQQIRRVSRIVQFGAAAAQDLRPLRARNALDTVAPGVARSGVSKALAAAYGATSLGSGDIGPRQFVHNIAGDVKALATGPFIGGYELGAGAYETVRHGDTSRLQRLGRGVAKGIGESVPGQLVQGKAEGAFQSFREHPLLAALDVSAAGAVVGRSAGAVARGLGSTAEAEGVRGALARAGSTVRPPIALVDDPGAVRRGAYRERRYSKDLTRKSGEAARDSQREVLRDAKGRPVMVEQRGRMVPVLKASRAERARQNRREANVYASRATSVERMVRDEADREMKVRGIRGRRAQDLVSMVVEGTITSAKHFEADLRAHRDRLKEALGSAEYRHTGERKAAEDRLALVEKVLANPKAMAQREKIVAAGEEIGRKLNEREREAVKLGLIPEGQARRSRLVPVAVEHLGGRHYAPEELRALARSGEDVSPEALRHGAIRHADGKFMSNDEIEATLRARGRDPETVAYLPHRLDVRGARAFHTQFRPGTRPTFDKGQARTGSAYAKGVTEASTDLIRDQGVRQATQIAKAKAIDRAVGERGTKRPDGRYFTAREALETRDRLDADTGEQYVAMRALPAKLDAETQRIIREELQGPGGMELLGQRLLNDRIVSAEDAPGAARARNVVLMPKEFVDQLNRHLKPADAIRRFFQFFNRPFRFAVLPQPRWLTGNFVEPYLIRLTTTGSGINVFGLGVDIAAATRAVRRMERSGDPRLRQAAQEIRAHQFGGLFIGGRGAGVRRTSEELPGALKWGAIVRDLPVVKQGWDLLRVMPDAFFKFNRVIESGAQRAALGKELRKDVQEFTGSWMKSIRLQAKALDEASKGLVNTATQRRFIESQHEVLGKYEGYAPWLRELIQGPMPFLPWALNAARFTFWTMPAHRTVQTALLLKVNDVVSKDWEEIHKKVPPGSLRLAVPTKKGGWVDLARYTPWGLAGPVAEGGGFESLNQIAPQFQGAGMAFFLGLDPFGRELKVKPSRANPKGTASQGKRIEIAANQLAEALIPYLSNVRRLREGGSTALSDSTVFSPSVKPGTDTGGAVDRTINPIRPTYLGARPGPQRRAAGPRTRQEVLLDRRARLLEGARGSSSRLEELLERRARLLESR